MDEPPLQFFVAYFFQQPIKLRAFTNGLFRKTTGINVYIWLTLLYIINESQFIIFQHSLVMRTSICLIAFLACAFSVVIQNYDTMQVSSYSNTLRFDNHSDPGATSDQLKAFKIFANEASTLYKDDVLANAQYIKEQMDSMFGSVRNNFYIIIQTKKVVFNWIVIFTIEDCVAALSGINPINPEWSYLFVKLYIPAQSPFNTFITPQSKGSGVEASFQAFAVDTVKKYESGSVCTCNDSETNKIENDILRKTNILWNTICSDKDVTYGLIYSVDKLWLYTKPKNCYYAFYVIQ